MTAAPVPSEQLDLSPLMTRRDGPGLIHFGIQLLAFGVAVWATLALAQAEHPAAWVAVLACAFALLTFFPSLHEAGHQTAFAARWLNEAAVWISAVLMLQAPSFFRAFHWEHHRETQDPERDPEISSAPKLLDDWPGNPAVYALVVCGQPLMFGKLGFSVGCALTPHSIWGRFFPFIRKRAVRRVAWESRAVLALLGSGVWLGVELVPGFTTLLWAWPVSHVLLGFYLMPEHTGLPHAGSQFDRTRTVESNRVVRWLMWNMPYHTEHHAHPGVPYHAVPELHRALKQELRNTSPGYAAFHVEAFRRMSGRRGQRDGLS